MAPFACKVLRSPASTLSPPYCASQVCPVRATACLPTSVVKGSSKWSTQLHLRCSRVTRALRPRRIARAMYVDDDDGGYLIDAPESQGDGFSFAGGKYANEEGPADIWEAKGKYLEAYLVQGGVQKAKDPLFGLAMAESSQAAGEQFRWFYTEEGDATKKTVLLLHGLPSQCFSYRKVLPVLSDDFHVVAADWIGFGFSDKPQPKYGFNYTIEEYSLALASLVDALDVPKVTLVVQGYFAPAVCAYAAANPNKVDRLVLINPPVTEEHSKLPSALSSFASFLLGEIFAQDPLRASDKLLASCCQYEVVEEDAMVYRSPYLSSGSAGFALVALTRNLQKELKGSLEAMRKSLTAPSWSCPTAIIWGRKDKWLSFTGVPEFAKAARASLTELAEVGHHAQEDYGEEVGKSLRTILRRSA
eukprot:TRINITY_DN11555_c0_g1_i1.p1 TRINITY_DN11555_c0_g1~~TRINITY_DN11555_c0_g1_i1.p1  ORF type:complete len:417 (+),score=63.29 TRINITY_DN11555_c0_g1_i1:113-1363(+)